uniref:Uncharacterized protein n=1 Tax=Physcomitrium patens TaxID=3218 RepID=A0A2K1L1G2_PHYPA|nr:hypothetical protein PHYPA_002658 [Physcomitrium patens]
MPKHVHIKITKNRVGCTLTCTIRSPCDCCWIVVAPTVCCTGCCLSVAPTFPWNHRRDLGSNLGVMNLIRS